MAIKASYDSKVNKSMNLKPIVLEIDKAMLHNEVHRFSDEIIFVSDDFTEVPPFIHPIYSPEKDIAFIDVRGFSSVGRDGNLTLKGDVDSEFTLLRAKLELVWQRAPRSETFTAFHFANQIFVRWLSDTICHKQGLQLGQKSKVLAVTGLYNIGLYYNNITDEQQINKYAEMISRDFYIPLEEVFSVIDTLDNPFPRDVDEYVDALKQMQISPRLANFNTVALYSMLGGSWFMTANAMQVIGLSVEYPPCFAAMVSMATRHKIFKKTQIGERVDRANKGGAYEQYARAINAVINNNLGDINPNRQRVGMESFPYNTIMIDYEEMVKSHGVGMEGLSTGQAVAAIIGSGFIAAFMHWLWQKLNGSSGGGGGVVADINEKKDNIEQKLVENAKSAASNKKAAAEIKADAGSMSEAMNDTIVADVGRIVEKGADKKIEAIVDRNRNRIATPVINVAVKYEPSQEPTNHWANMEALIKTVEHIEDPIELAAIFEVYKRTLHNGDRIVKVILSDFLRHPLYREDIYLATLLFSGATLPHVQTDEAVELAHGMMSAVNEDILVGLGDFAAFLQELSRSAADDSISDEELNKTKRHTIETNHQTLMASVGNILGDQNETNDYIGLLKDQIDSVWSWKRSDNFETWDNTGNYANRFASYVANMNKDLPKIREFADWVKEMNTVAGTQNSKSREWAIGVNEAGLWDRYDPDLRQMLRDITRTTRYMVYYTTQALRLNSELVNTASALQNAMADAHAAINKNLQVMKRELDRAGKKAGLENFNELEGEFLPAQKSVGMEMHSWTDIVARIGVGVVVGLFFEWVVRKITGSSGGGGGGGSRRAGITWKLESAAETVVRVGEKLSKTKSNFLEFNSELNRRKLKDDQLMALVNTDADKIILRKFLTAIDGDDHMLRLFAVLIVNAGSGKNDSQFTFLGVSATDRDWDKWVLAALNNFRKVGMPNDMEFEKYLLFCGMSIPGAFVIANVIESINVTEALQRIEVETEIVEEIFRLGEDFDDAGAKRVADEIRKQGSGPASDSKEVSIPGTTGRTYREIFDEARSTSFSIWPGAIFRNGMSEDQRLADIKTDQWRTLLDTKRLNTKLGEDKNTLKRMEDKAKSMTSSLERAARSASLRNIHNPSNDDYKVINEFMSKKSVAMAEIQAYLQAVNAYTVGVERQTAAMNAACSTLEARMANVRTLLKKV